MRRWVTIGVIITLVTILVILSFTFLGSQRKGIGQFTNDEVVKTMQSTLTSYNSKYRVDKISIHKREVYLDQWLIIKATLDNESTESEARDMTYVFANNEGTLQLIAYSGDGFSSNSFPPSAPDSLIERANQP